jgi:hypothetical protein
VVGGWGGGGGTQSKLRKSEPFREQYKRYV